MKKELIIKKPSPNCLAVCWPKGLAPAQPIESCSVGAKEKRDHNSGGDAKEYRHEAHEGRPGFGVGMP